MREDRATQDAVAEARFSAPRQSQRLVLSQSSVPSVEIQRLLRCARTDTPNGMK